MPRFRMCRHLDRTTSDVFDIIRAVEATARPRTTKLLQVGGGEIPLRADVGQPFLTKYRYIFLTARTALGDYALHGVYLPRALCCARSGAS